jgi:hypothetical protein
MRELLLSFLGLQRASGRGTASQEAATMALFRTLAKTHNAGIQQQPTIPQVTLGQSLIRDWYSLYMAVGQVVLPDGYQAYHILCAQLFGVGKATALLHAPLTVRNFSGGSRKAKPLGASPNDDNGADIEKNLYVCLGFVTRRRKSCRPSWLRTCLVCMPRLPSTQVTRFSWCFGTANQRAACLHGVVL